jgi:hypothetical protein
MSGSNPDSVGAEKLEPITKMDFGDNFAPAWSTLNLPVGNLCRT